MPKKIHYLDTFITLNRLNVYNFITFKNLPQKIFLHLLRFYPLKKRMQNYLHTLCRILGIYVCKSF